MITNKQAIEARKLLKDYCKQREKCFNKDKTRCPFSEWHCHFDVCTIDSIINHHHTLENMIIILSALFASLDMLVSVIYKIGG